MGGWAAHVTDGVPPNTLGCVSIQVYSKYKFGLHDEYKITNTVMMAYGKFHGDNPNVWMNALQDIRDANFSEYQNDSVSSIEQALHWAFKMFHYFGEEQSAEDPLTRPHYPPVHGSMEWPSNCLMREGDEPLLQQVNNNFATSTSPGLWYCGGSAFDTYHSNIKGAPAWATFSARAGTRRNYEGTSCSWSCAAWDHSRLIRSALVSNICILNASSLRTMAEFPEVVIPFLYPFWTCFLVPKGQ